MSAGKGDNPRPVKGEQYRANFDRIDFGSKIAQSIEIIAKGGGDEAGVKLRNRGKPDPGSGRVGGG